MTDLPPRHAEQFCLSGNVDYRPEDYVIPRQRADWRHVEFQSTAPRKKTWLEIANTLGLIAFLAAAIAFICFAK